MKTSIPILLLAILFCIFIPNKGEPRKGPLEPPGIVIVDVQDRDLAAYGRWPWPREFHGRALDVLNRQGAVGVYFDYIFSEEDARWPQKDRALSDAIKESRIPVFLPYCFILEGGKGEFPYPVPLVKMEGRSRLKKVDMQVLPCLPLFAEKATAMGYINYFPDEKHVLRELHLLLEWKGEAYPHVAVPIAAHLCSVPMEQLLFKDQCLHLGAAKLHLSRQAALMPEFGQPFTKFTHYCYSDLLEGKLTDKIRGKFVIMGFNATGMSDFVVTDSSNRYPGSEVHAVLIDLILRKILWPADDP